MATEQEIKQKRKKMQPEVVELTEADVFYIKSFMTSKTPEEIAASISKPLVLVNKCLEDLKPRVEHKPKTNTSIMTRGASEAGDDFRKEFKRPDPPQDCVTTCK